MPVRHYCRFNSFCVNANCSFNHHRPMDERTLLHNIINETPEISEMKEESDPRKTVPCAHGLRCFEKECTFFHGINHDGRKILTKKFNKQFKAIKMQKKIKEEIENIGKNGMPKWDD